MQLRLLRRGRRRLIMVPSRDGLLLPALAPSQPPWAERKPFNVYRRDAPMAFTPAVTAVPSTPSPCS